MSETNPGATRPRPSLGDAVRLAAWAYTPFQRLAARDLYSLLATRAFTANGLYLTGCRDQHATPPAPVAAVIQASGNRHSIVIKKSYAMRLTQAGSP